MYKIECIVNNHKPKKKKKKIIKVQIPMLFKKYFVFPQYILCWTNALTAKSVSLTYAFLPSFASA